MRETLEGLTKQFGKIPNIFATMAHRPNVQTVLKATGHSEIAYEFSGQSSDRARREAQKWEAEILRSPLEDRDVLNVIHLVRLTELYAPKEWGVGGEIDVAEITPTNGVHWIRRKPECQETSADAALRPRPIPAAKASVGAAWEKRPGALFNENFAAYVATLPPNTTAPGPP